ncbi:MAG: tyrosine-type recombinase/integrase [Bosea sp. (in: a-proteobacteria)]
MKFTKASVAGLVLPAGKSEAIVFDDDLPGFGLRIRAGGKRSWIVQYRVGTKQRRVSLGSVGALGAEEARKEARNALAKVQLGADPQTEKRQARAKASATFGASVETFLGRPDFTHLAAKTRQDMSRYLRIVAKRLHEIGLDNVKRRDIAALLADVGNQRGAPTANRTRAALSSFWSWAMGAGIAQENPVIGTNKAEGDAQRERVLAPDELRAIWQASEENDFGHIVRLLILTGQRREEIGSAKWSEISSDGRTLALPSLRTKNGRPHDVPLARQAQAIVSALTRGDRTHLFGDRDTGFQGWSNSKARLDERAKLGAGQGAFAEPWRLHDLRRTAATMMAEIGVQPHIIEAVLNHVSGHKAGVAGIYNRAAYAAEKRQALDLWAEYVAALVAGSEPKVVLLKKQA